VPAEVPYKVGTMLSLEVAWNVGDKTHTSSERVTRVSPPAETGAGVRTATWDYDYAGIESKLGLIQGHRVQQLRQEGNGPTVYNTFEHVSLTVFLNSPR